MASGLSEEVVAAVEPELSKEVPREVTLAELSEEVPVEVVAELFEEIAVEVAAKEILVEVETKMHDIAALELEMKMPEVFVKLESKCMKWPWLCGRGGRCCRGFPKLINLFSKLCLCQFLFCLCSRP